MRGAPASTPLEAATIVVLREAAAGLEVFLMQRGAGTSFMAGAHVFPGGKLDPGDQTDEVLARLPAGAVERCRARLDPTPGRALEERAAAGLFVAACRETFEEAGVLLARRKGSSDLVDLSRPEDAARMASWREKLLRGEVEVGALLDGEDLELALDSLHYWAHWITPSRERKRYDTRFFLALLPRTQIALPDHRESGRASWMAPRDALHAHREGQIFVPPPTQRTLEEIEAFDRFDGLVEASRGREVFAIMPKLTVVDDQITILLPWDPLYETTEGEGTAVPHGRAAGERASRITVTLPR